MEGGNNAKTPPRPVGMEVKNSVVGCGVRVKFVLKGFVCSHNPYILLSNKNMRKHQILGVVKNALEN